MSSSFCRATSAASASSRSAECARKTYPHGSSDGLGARLEASRYVAVEAHRLAGEDAVDARAPLLADPARLDTRSLRADARPLVDDDLGPALREVQRDGEARDAGADDRDPHRTLSR